MQLKETLSILTEAIKSPTFLLSFLGCCVFAAQLFIVFLIPSRYILAQFIAFMFFMVLDYALIFSIGLVIEKRKRTGGGRW